ncbi:MAG TPA: signal peptidase II [candidate division Zixibacteria bacterium]|nr:signal peptidase II [candidate division Zixibacteria bacterium]
MPDCVSNAKRRKRRPKLADINKRHLLVPFLMLAAVVIADQLSKSYALNHLTEGRIHRVAGSFFQFKLVFNKGGALGTDFGSGAFYLISSLLILLIVIYLIVVNRDKLFISVPIAAIAGGAAGNIIDRIRIGKVVDFIDVDFFDINAFGLNIDRWWVFNIADAAITVGVIFLLVYLLFYGKKREVIESGAGLPTDKIAGKMN